MAQFGFGLNINETAQQNGYDLYKTTIKESLGATAADNWKYNPFQSIKTYYNLENAKSMSQEQGILPISRKELNKEYSNLGLYFEQDEQQSVVDIMVTQKKEELERQSIMARGPEGSWNPLSGGFYVGAAKLAVGIGVSFLDPINIGASFIPVFGQARFAAIAARTGFKTARAVRGGVEGAVGATLLEPIVYGSAQKVQADYDLVDSFMNIGFGTIIGSGLHVGAGALKDIGTAQKFEAQVIKNKENLDGGKGGEPELNLYNQYYPVNGDFMMKLEKTDPRTRELLLAKAIGDLSLENPVNVLDTANADAVLREGTANPVTTEIKTNTKNIFNDTNITPVNKNIDNLSSAENDIVINRESQDLLNLRNKQTEQGLNLKTDFGNEGIPDVVKNTTEALDDINANSKQVEEAVADYINCTNGNT
tara:strand:- start:2547 stop:3812 length:1266 start_codon:yes stop_codon:yes gene_type:complete